ncbi:MAG: hypothetical protein V2A76_01835 [Planctomycetota bacterium]
MRSIHPALTLLLSLALSSATPAHEIEPLGTEFVATSRTAYDQHDVWVGCDDDGNFVISYAQGDIYARRFNQDGRPLADDELVNPTINYGTQDETYLAMDPSTGDYFVGFSDRNGNDGDLMAAGGRFFHADGSAYGAEQLLNVNTVNSQFEPHAAFMVNGRVMVAWGDDGTDGSCGCVGRIFDRTGAPLSGEFLINEASSATQIDPSLSCSRNGLFVCAYVDASGVTGAPREVMVRLFNQDGAALGSSRLVNTVSAGMQRDPSVAMSGLGNFVVVWQDESGLDGNGFGVFGRLFDANGLPRGDQFLITQTTAGNQQDPQVTMDYAGNFVVTWECNAGGDFDVLVRMFDRNGVPLSDEVQVHENTAGQQQKGKSCLVQSGERLITVWHDANGDGAVNARIFTMPTITVGGGSAIGESVTFDLEFPGMGGRSFVLLPSLGQTPGLQVTGSRTADVEPDATMDLVLDHLGSGLFGNLSGTLDPNGQAQATFSIPHMVELYHRPIYFVGVTKVPGFSGTWDPTSGSFDGVEFLSEAVTVTVDGPPRFHPGVELLGQVASASDEDWASFEATKGEKLKFKVVAADPSLPAENLGRIHVEIMDLDHVVVKSWTKDAPTAEGKQNLKFKAPDHGTYLLRVTGDNGSIGNYKMLTSHKLKKKGREQKVKVKVGDSLFASIKLYAVKDATLSIAVKPQGGAAAPASLDMDAPSGATTSFTGPMTLGDDGKYYTAPITLTETGQYTLNLGGQQGDKYKVTVTPTPPVGEGTMVID